MAWRLARSLDVLRDEVEQVAPGTTVWTIGDDAHVVSDHRPNQDDVVCASDTLGNAGLDLAWYAEQVRTSGHVALKYVIHDRRIASARSDPPFSWRPYVGDNPHTGHVHVSVGVGPDGRSTGPYDDTSPWGLLDEGDDMDASDRIDLPGWAHKWGADDISVGAALANSYAHGRNGVVEARAHAREVLAGQEAILAAVAGDDVVAAVRAEFARLAPALAEQLAEVPAERVEAALRAVLRTGVDEPEPA